MGRLHFLMALRHMKKDLLSSNPKRILEAGTKQGHLAFWLARSYGCQVVGLDLNQTQVAENERLARQLDLKNLSFLQADLTKPLPSVEKFDLILCLHVLEHIAADDLALKSLFEATADNGRLIILVPGGLETIPDFSPEQLALLDHVRPGYTLVELSQKVAAAGYEISWSGPAVGLWGTWAGQIDFHLCLSSKQFIWNSLGTALSTILVFLEYYFPIRPKYDVLLVAWKRPAWAVSG